MSIRVFALASALTAALGAPALGQGNADWTRPFPAFKLIGNVYWVGTYDLSTYLITSSGGHFLINTGLPATVPQIKPGDAYDPSRFVDPMGYRAAVERAEKTYLDQLAKERTAESPLAPTGTLRVAFLGTNPVHARVNPQTGAITGPVADLVAELAKRKGVPFKLLPAPDVRGVIALMQSGEADAGVMAYEAARAREVDFAGGFAVMFNSYVVRTASPLKTVADADRAGITIGAVRGQTQEIFLSANLKQAKLRIYEAQPQPDELRRLLATDELNAFAMNQQRIEDAISGAAGELRALSGSYVDVEQSFVVKKGDAARAAELKAFVDQARDSGLTKAALDRAKLVGVSVARPR